ncbi:LysR family transcriptional regulator [Bosea sp. LjRoot9]|uniref:LysR family transcriptional regulator n=1 Tax=Bosea sp. LjRoot9 TaxID=3342341 RepID=UPI003ECFB63E
MLTRVTLDQLQMLIAIAEAGSFSAAARKVNRGQSAVSQAIQSLEAVLELKLFDRSRKLPFLTEAGRAIVEDARKIVNGTDALRMRAKNMATVAEPEISLAIEQVFPSTVLIESLSAFRTQFPLVSVNLFAEGLGAPEQSLFEGLVRLAIYSTARDGMPGFQMEFLGEVPISLVASAQHPLAQVEGLIPQAVLEEHIQLTMIDRTKRYRGVVMGTRTWSFIDQFSRLDFVRNGFGWCAMPTHLAQAYLETGEMVELKLAAHRGLPLKFPLYAVHRIEQPPGPAALWLLSDLRQRFSDWIDASTAERPPGPGIQIRVTTV